MAKYILDKMKTFKAPLVVAAIMTLVVDIVAFIMLIAFQFEFKYVICPLIAFLVDGLFVLATFNTNYRFKYSATSVVLYLITMTILSIIPFLTINVFGETAIFTTLGGLIFIAAHVLLLVGIAMLYKTATKPIISAPKVSSVVVTIMLVVVCVFTIAFVADNGYFGQGNESKTLVYEYNEKTKTYSVVDVLRGKGDKVVIPTEFNGNSVTEIDVALFGRDDVKEVVINSQNVKLINRKNTKKINNNLVVKVGKEQYDVFKNNLLKMFKNEQYVSLLNNIKPIVSENEVYVSFDYTFEQLEKLNYETLPTWFGKKGDTFSMSFCNRIEYTTHMNKNSTDDLDWCYQNLNSVMLDSLIYSNEKLDGARIYNSIDDCDINLIDIYAFTFMEDNDTKYSIPEEYRVSSLKNGRKLEYKLLTFDELDDLYDDMSDRDGFSFTIKSSNGLNSYANFKDMVKKTGKKELTILPEWKLDAPVIAALNVNGKDYLLDGKKLELTYGDLVYFIPGIRKPISGINVKYSWMNGTTLLTNNMSHSETFRTVKENYAYTFCVEAYSDTITSLTSKSTVTVTFDVNKKDLAFTWHLLNHGSLDTLSNVTYDGYDKEVSVSYTGAVLGDLITYNLSSTKQGSGTTLTYNDAVSDAISIVLTGSTAECYKLSSNTVSTKRFAILPKPISVTYDDITFTYDGETHKPTAACDDIFGNALTIDISGAKKDAGTYTAYASCANTNYEITNNSTLFTIEKRSITVTANTTSSTYGESILDISSTVTKGSLVDEANLVYSITTNLTEKSSVGTYTAIGNTLNSNYSITFEKLSNVYTITKRIIDFKIDSKSVTYGDNIVQLTATVSSGSLASFDTVSNVISLTLPVGFTKESDVNSYVISGELINDNYQIADGVISNGTYTVNKRNLTVRVNSTSSYYGDDRSTLSATVYSGSLPTFHQLTDIISLSCSVDSASNVGNYNITGSSLNSNYIISFTNQSGSYTVLKRPIKVTIDNKTSIYGNTLVPLTARVTSGSIVNGDTAYSLSTTATKTSNVGGYTIRGTVADSNYNVTFTNGTYTITKRPITYTIDDKTSVYGDSIVSLTDELTSGSIISGDTLYYSLSTTATKSSNVGTYSITGKETQSNSNYDVTFISGTYTITKRPIVVTIEDKTSVYGDSIVSLTAKVTSGSIVNGDTAYSLSTLATKTSNVGSYKIEGTVADSNYYVEFISGTYEITIRPIELLIDSKTSVYGDEIVPLTAKVTSGSIVNGDTPYRLSTTATKTSDVGIYQISGTVLNDNYAVVFICDTYKITKRSIVVTIEDKSGVYGDEIVPLTASVTSGSIVNGDTPYSLSTTATKTSDVGIYQISGTVADNNYNVTFVSGIYKINAKTISVEWDMTQDIPKAANLEGIDVTYEYYNLAGELLTEIPSEAGEYKCVVVCANKNYVLTNNECIFEIIDSEVQ